MQATDSFPIDSLKMLRSTITRIEGAYAPQPFGLNFAAFITFCDLKNATRFAR